MVIDLTPHIPTIEDVLSRLPPSLGFGGIPLSSIAAEHDELLREIREFDPLALASCFGALLTVPELQSNCARLEVLTHLCLASAFGTRKPTKKIVSRLFKVLGDGMTGLQEDPAEDIFVSVIVTPRGNFRVLEGIWESAGFHTQRVLNALEMACGYRAATFTPMLNAVYAMLKLSDLVCERSGLPRYVMGNASPESRIPTKVLEELKALRSRISFREDQLVEAGISVSEIAEFGFDPSARFALISQVIGHSSLERHPIAFRDDEFRLLLPTAATAAIRRFVIERLQEANLGEFFASLLAHELADSVKGITLLGDRMGAPIEFQRTDNGALAGVMYPADRGRIISFVFFADTLEGFSAAGGLVGAYPAKNAEGLRLDVENWIDHAYQAARKNPGFRDGITLLVGCGVGRAILDVTPRRQRDNWRVEFVSAPDLFTLSSVPDFNPLSLWRLLAGRDRLEEVGVELFNINGLLNLVGWARSLGGHLVPHADMPAEFGSSDAGNFVMVEQNALLRVRREVAEKDDRHAIQTIDGKWVSTRRDSQSIFDEDAGRPFYVSDESHDRWPMAVYETKARAWWVKLATTEQTQGLFAYHRYQMLRTWLTLAAPVLEREFPQLPGGPLLWQVSFESDLGDRAGLGEREFMTLDETLPLICVEASERAISTICAPEFENAIYNPINIAEHALVTRLVEGVASLANVGIDEVTRDEIVARIVTSPEARQSHAFRTQNFRDFVKRAIWPSPMLIDTDDSATIKLGLGWRDRKRSESAEIVGQDACTDYLNRIVRMLEDEICEDLRAFDRRSTIKFALMNHESAGSDRDSWRRTAGAVIALHKDKAATLATIGRHEAELNAVFQASRLMVEFAICECPIEGGIWPGKLDMSQIMSKIMMLCGMGGWSDAIHWQAMQPLVRITPLGDIHANVTFQEQVLTPYGQAMTDMFVQENIDDYADNMREPQALPTDTSSIDAEFFEAFEEQFGASFVLARKFIDDIEDLGIKQNTPVLTLKRSEVLAITSQGDDPAHAQSVGRLLDFLTLKGRPSWRDVPEGYLEKDLFPWRFRRRLSVLRKPFVQIDDKDDPTLMFAPAILREGFGYAIRNYHTGDFPRWQLTPKMKTWAGRARDRMGKKFTAEVANRLKELGWQARTEVRITKFLGKGFDIDYGDIDVLAWNPESGRVLLVECKDVQHRKTDGEIAEQLLDFRGELDENGKPDLLLKHLRRIELVKRHVPEVMKHLGLSSAPTLEGHLVFKNPVPMKFAWDRMKQRVKLHVFGELSQI